MGSLNKAMIIGYLGNDPDVRYMPSGEMCATISVATSARWKDKQTGEQKERTEWHRCVCFGRRAETMSEYLKKGSQVYIEGEIRTNKYTDKDGVDRWSTEIYVFQFSFLDRKEGGGSRSPHPADASSAEPPSADQDAPSAGASDSDEFDDDIPF